jgi:CheY-like chemotaxis protein
MLLGMNIVKKHNIQILTASDGEVALKEFKDSKTVRLVLMDCEMPNKNGYDATISIRNFEEEIKADKCYIVGVSGNEGKEHTDKCVRSGMDESIHKPIKIAELKRIVNLIII